MGGNGSGGGARIRPAGGTEPVYVPGQPQSTDQGVNQGSGPGQSQELVPYGQVLSQYQQQAIQDVGRADIPEQEQQLVQQYFSGLGG